VSLGALSQARLADLMLVDAVLRNGSPVPGPFHLFLAQKQGETPDFACSMFRARVDFAVFSGD
jgi:hypothetical protein